MPAISSRLINNGDMTEETNRGNSYSNVVFEVMSDKVDDSPMVVLGTARDLSGPADVPPPGRGDSYDIAGSEDPGSFAKTVQAVRPNPDSKPSRWEIRVNYQPLEAGETSAALAQPNPLLWDRRYWIEWASEQIAVEKAFNRTPLTHLNIDDPNNPGNLIPRAAGIWGSITNAAGKQFDTVPMRDKQKPILNIQQNIATLDELLAWNANFLDTTNDAQWFGQPANTWSFLTATAGSQKSSTVIDWTDPLNPIPSKILYYEMLLRVELDVDNWDLKLLNVGYDAFDPGPPKSTFKIYVDVQDENGNVTGREPASEPQKLKLDGTIMDQDEDASYVDYYYLRPVDYKQIDPAG